MEETHISKIKHAHDAHKQSNVVSKIHVTGVVVFVQGSHELMSNHEA